MNNGVVKKLHSAVIWLAVTSTRERMFQFGLVISLYKNDRLDQYMYDCMTTSDQMCVRLSLSQSQRLLPLLCTQPSRSLSSPSSGKCIEINLNYLAITE